MKLINNVIVKYVLTLSITFFGNAINSNAQIELINDSNFVIGIKFNNGLTEKIEQVDGLFSKAGISGDGKIGFVKRVSSLMDSLALYEIYDSIGNEVRRFTGPNLSRICIAKDLRYAIYGSGFTTEIATRENLLLYDNSGNLKYSSTKPLSPNINCKFINNGDYFYAFADSIENRTNVRKTILIIFDKEINLIGKVEIVSDKLHEYIHLDFVDEQAMTISFKIRKYMSSEVRLIKYNYYGVLIN
ncbi:MAG: hypothetical protein IPN61_01295 [Bacteroidetes bacterium]|nr:hypothetical protein [Bacteroidota bacterium]MBK8363212.1 hypothetical protein [Bacteroidota bacterium]MBK9412053.1 hypothetical protein [Bacteroidota bacterium]